MKKWDLSLGRLTEPMGVTGYWFGREYDGIRGVYTGKTAQLRIGFGTFKQSTGVSDTAYTHVTYTDFYRPPTAAELMGILREGLMYGIQDEDVAALTKEYEENYKGKTDNAFFYQQIKEAYDNSASIEEKTAIIKRLHGIVKAAYGNELANKVIAFDAPSGTQVLYEVEDAHGNVKVKKTDVYYSSYISDYDSDEEKAFKKRMNQKFGFNAASDEAFHIRQQFCRGLPVQASTRCCYRRFLWMAQLYIYGSGYHGVSLSRPIRKRKLAFPLRFEHEQHPIQLFGSTRRRFARIRIREQASAYRTRQCRRQPYQVTGNGS